jgi:hypothetical protein
VIATGSRKFITDYFFVALLQAVTTAGLYGIFLIEIYLAEKIKNEGKKMKSFLFQILHKVDEFKLKEMIESFIYQIDHSPMEVSSVFFDFNWRFMFKVKLNFSNGKKIILKFLFITAGIMYFVMLLEFEDSLKNKV